MSIPARLRRVFDAGDPAFATANTGRTQLVAVYGPDWWNWIELYTIEAIEEIDAQIDRLTRGSQERRWLELLMNGQSTDLEIDREGRLVLPQKLREKIGLDDKAFFIAAGDYLKVWRPETYAEAEGDEVEALVASFEPGFDPRALLPQLVPAGARARAAEE